MAQSKPLAGHSLAASLQPLLRTRKAELSVGELMERIESGDGPGPRHFLAAKDARTKEKGRACRGSLG